VTRGGALTGERREKMNLIITMEGEIAVTNLELWRKSATKEGFEEVNRREIQGKRKSRKSGRTGAQE